MDSTTWGAEQWSAFGSVGALVVATVVGFFVWLQVRHAVQAREEQTRPYVILDFEFTGWWVQLIIKNIGTTPARDVAVSFDKPLQLPSKERDRANFEIFRRPIPMIAPGRVVKLDFGSGPSFFEENAVAEAWPLDYTAPISYTDLSGKKKYPDPPIYLDLKPYKNAISENDPLKEIASETKEIRRTMKSWTSMQALKVRAIDQGRADRRTHRLLRKQRATAVLRDRGWLGTIKWQWSQRRRRARG